VAPEPRSTRWSDQVASFAIVELSTDGVVQTWNAGAERIKGYTAEQIIGTHFSRFYRAEDRARGVPEALLASALAHGYVEDTGWRVRADGDLFWAHVTITTVRDSRGQAVGFVKIVRDLTASKRADDELNAFVRAFAHDFVSPITAIRGYVDLLQEQLGDDHEYLQRLAEASDHLTEMTAALAQRVRADTAKRQSQPVLAGTVVREAASLVLPGDLYGRLSIAVHDDAVVQADPSELRRAVQNVLENAAKYSEGPIEVSVESTDDTVEITVNDRGRGIHPDDLRIILRDGERGRLARPDDGGSGIGLASAIRAIEEDGGAIDIRSELGKGTAVRIRLPRAAAAAAAA
jgi:PAS domain S-box-containing protein